jgi:uncharacterized membrane protein YedE/YeeE
VSLLTTPWPWYASGALIGFTMLTMLFLGRRFGLSTNLKTLCTLAGANRLSKYTNYFSDGWRPHLWNLVFALGAALGGTFMALAGAKRRTVDLDAGTVAQLERLGVAQGPGLMPDALFGTAAFANPGAWALWIVGGFLVGFGARWANGCTSGHGISGLSALQKGSLLALLGFFGGGLFATHVLYPWILS